jgi:hypothetical protein
LVAICGGYPGDVPRALTSELLLDNSLEFEPGPARKGLVPGKKYVSFLAIDFLRLIDFSGGFAKTCGGCTFDPREYNMHCRCAYTAEPGELDGYFVDLSKYIRPIR